VLCVVPGSRGGEVGRLLPIFAQAVMTLKERFPDLHVVIPVASAVAETVQTQTQNWPVPVTYVTNPDERFDAFAACDAAMAKSGTVTLELALARVPMVVAYKVNALTAFLVRRMGVSVEYASLVNLLTHREVVPELLQEACTPGALGDEVTELLSSHEARAAQRAGYQEMMDALGAMTPPPSERAAQVVLDVVRARAA
jgi:lipid-A-disaccharide synthase